MTEKNYGWIVDDIRENNEKDNIFLSNSEYDDFQKSFEESCNDEGKEKQEDDEEEKSDFGKMFFETISAFPVLHLEDYRKLYGSPSGLTNEAKAKIINSNQGLVVKEAKKFNGMGVDFWVRISAGNDGLRRAIERFDVERGNQFSTYATVWIYYAILQEVNNTLHPRELTILDAPISDNGKTQKDKYKDEAAPSSALSDDDLEIFTDLLCTEEKTVWEQREKEKKGPKTIAKEFSSGQYKGLSKAKYTERDIIALEQNANRHLRLLKYYLPDYRNKDIVFSRFYKDVENRPEVVKEDPDLQSRGFLSRHNYLNLYKIEELCHNNKLKNKSIEDFHVELLNDTKFSSTRYYLIQALKQASELENDKKWHCPEIYDFDGFASTSDEPRYKAYRDYYIYKLSTLDWSEAEKKAYNKDTKNCNDKVASDARHYLALEPYRKITLDMCIKICFALGMDLDWANSFLCDMNYSMLFPKDDKDAICIHALINGLSYGKYMDNLNNWLDYCNKNQMDSNFTLGQEEARGYTKNFHEELKRNSWGGDFESFKKAYLIKNRQYFCVVSTTLFHTSIKWQNHVLLIAIKSRMERERASEKVRNQLSQVMDVLGINKSNNPLEWPSALDKVVRDDSTTIELQKSIYKQLIDEDLVSPENFWKYLCHFEDTGDPWSGDRQIKGILENKDALYLKSGQSAKELQKDYPGLFNSGTGVLNHYLPPTQMQKFFESAKIPHQDKRTVRDWIFMLMLISYTDDIRQTMKEIDLWNNNNDGFQSWPYKEVGFHNGFVNKICEEIEKCGLMPARMSRKYDYMVFKCALLSSLKKVTITIHDFCQILISIERQEAFDWIDANISEKMLEQFYANNSLWILENM